MKLYQKIKNRAIKTSREFKLEHFMTLYKKGMNILDVGVSAEDSRNRPKRNYFIKNFPFSPNKYTGLGVQDLTETRIKFPDLNFVEYNGKNMPFEEKEFDLIYCNAVIEHVGFEVDQVHFLNEMLRVSKQVYFTTPNKYFPIETHTNIFLIHWVDKIFYNYLQSKKPHRTKENLFLFSHKRLKKVIGLSNVSEFEIYKNKYFGMTMTFTVICK